MERKFYHFDFEKKGSGKNDSQKSASINALDSKEMQEYQEDQQTEKDGQNSAVEEPMQDTGNIKQEVVKEQEVSKSANAL